MSPGLSVKTFSRKERGTVWGTRIITEPTGKAGESHGPLAGTRDLSTQVTPAPWVCFTLAAMPDRLYEEERASPECSRLGMASEKSRAGLCQSPIARISSLNTFRHLGNYVPRNSSSVDRGAGDSPERKPHMTR